MANVFVNRSGNNANSGATRALAKLTIQGAHDAAVDGADTVKIGSAEYREQVSNTKALTYEADIDSPNVPSGFVVIDGENTRASGISLAASKAVTVRGLTFRRHTAACIDGAAATSQALTAIRCAFLDSVRGWRNTNAFSSDVLFSRCTFRDLSNTGILNLTTQQSITASHCLFQNCAFGYSQSVLPTNLSLFNNVFKDCGRDIDLLSSTLAQVAAFLIDYNSHFGWTTALGRIANVDHATLAAWRTASGKEANSLDVDPLLLDAAKGLFLSRRDSPLRRRGQGGETIGLGTGEGISTNRNPLLWSGGIHSGTILTGGGDIEQAVAGVNGTYQTDVLDLGASVPVSRFLISALVSYPSQVIDSSIADSAPNRPTIEYRTSNSAFLKTDGAPAYVAIERDTFIDLPSAVTGRYWQFRFTLRSDGVAA